MRRILFIMHGSHGHLNASIELINNLIKDDHQVTVASSTLIETQLKELDFCYELISYMPFGCGYEDVISRENNLFYLGNLKLRLTDTLYINRKKELNEILIRVKPDIILLDLIYTTDLVLLWEYISSQNTKLIYVSPMVSLEEPLLILR